MRARRWGWGALALALAAVTTSGDAAAQSWPDVGAPLKCEAKGSRDAAVIVAIEDYLKVSDVGGARANGTDWYAHLTDAQGVPPERVHLLRDHDATREAILDHVKSAASEVEAGGTLWVVFIGHGAASADGSDGVLVGADAQQTAQGLYARSVAQKEILAIAESSRAAQKLVVLDACFSGRASDGSPIAAGLQPLIVVKNQAAPSVNGTAILTAGAGDQFAGPLPGAGRPAFSYLVLGALRGWGDADKDGSVTAIEASRYAQKTLAVLPTGRTQTPQAQGSIGMVVSRGATEPPPDLRKIQSESPRPKRPSPDAPPPAPPPQTPPPSEPDDDTFYGKLRGGAVPADAVRVSITSEDSFTVQNGEGKTICGVPCKLWVRPGADLKLVNAENPLEFYPLPTNLGPEGGVAEVGVKTQSGAYVAGFYALTFGISGAISGGVMLGLGLGLSDAGTSGGGGNSMDTFVTVGAIMLPVGAVLTAIGIPVMIANAGGAEVKDPAAPPSGEAPAAGLHLTPTGFGGTF